MVEYEASSNSAYMNLILRNPTYQEHIRGHVYCGNCLRCSNIKHLFQSKDSFDAVFAGLLNRSKINSPESLSFQTRLIQQSTCSCGNFLSTYPQATFKLIFKKQPINKPFSHILKDALDFPLADSCNKRFCDKKLGSSITTIEGRLTNLLFSVDWESRTLDSLLNFILNLDTCLDLNLLLGVNTQVYLQGMVLTGEHQSVYVQMHPCKIFVNTDNNPSAIYIEYLNFFMLQYSLYPTVLVYSENECGIEEYREKNRVFATVLEKYLGFLTGKDELCEEVCFFCWNLSHDACQEIICSAYWDCVCGWNNGKNMVFCQRCSKPQRFLTENDPKTCILCLEPMVSTYCFKCSFVANCSICFKSITKTQSVACLQCNEWLEGCSCKLCDRSINQVQVACQTCFMANYQPSRYCIHNGSKDCLQCFFSFKCGVCKRPKLCHEFKYCWKCKNKLIDGLCINCKHFPATNSFVCVDCVSGTKNCRVGHAITEQSVSECSECKQRSSVLCKNCTLGHKECIGRRFCGDCGLDLEFTLRACTLCESGMGEHSCAGYSVCVICYSQLSTCSCGQKLLSRQGRCLNCLKLRIHKKNLPKLVENPDKSGKKCLSCEFFQSNNSNFCENCNCPFDLPYSQKHTCPICKSDSSSKYCEFCYKTQNCSSCKKDLLIGQGLFCGTCMSKTCNRVCRTCNTIVPLSKVICLPCSLLTWRCSCNNVNNEALIRCLKCNRARIVPCTVCKRLSVFPYDSWRFPEKHLKPFPSDPFCCKDCSQFFRKCVCGFILLPAESICKHCDQVLD